MQRVNGTKPIEGRWRLWKDVLRDEETVFRYALRGIAISCTGIYIIAIVFLVDTVKELVGKKPIFGICLGHQILGLAFGGESFKLKFGHRGTNQPVKNLVTGKVEITAQNHGFCIDKDSLKDQPLRLTHINLNDDTLEGMEHEELPIFSVQYHPEASPGPHDADYLFDKFVDIMRKDRE